MDDLCAGINDWLHNNPVAAAHKGVVMDDLFNGPEGSSEYRGRFGEWQLNVRLLSDVHTVALQSHLTEEIDGRAI
jgi:hypothetical protein